MLFFVGSHYLEVDVVESSNKQPQFIVVETPECSKESEESLKEEGALFLVERVQKAGPGDHCQGDCTRNLREKRDVFFVLSSNAVLTLKAFNAYWVSYLRPEVNHGATVDIRLREKSRTRGQIH